MYRVVDGKQVDLTPQEISEFQSEWAREEAKANAEKKKAEVKTARILAVEAVLERLLSQNSDIPSVKAYLGAKK